jgi:hypothetical protein
MSSCCKCITLPGTNWNPDLAWKFTPDTNYAKSVKQIDEPKRGPFLRR